MFCSAEGLFLATISAEAGSKAMPSVFDLIWQDHSCFSVLGTVDFRLLFYLDLFGFYKLLYVKCTVVTFCNVKDWFVL